VSVDVYAYNSKFYYVITDFAGSGEQVVRLPSTGNETVLDAISLIGGLSAVSSTRLWIARPAPDGCGDQILPVDWKGITRRGNTRTNYQILPGDRVFVMSQPMTKADTVLARMLAPVERALGVTLLGVGTVRAIEGDTGFFGGNGGTTIINNN
jgi:polysaccharide export outer membrane protein